MSQNNYSKTAVLLLAFGGPDSLDNIEPFLKSIISGRPVTSEQVKRVKEKYGIIGGKSPLLDITNRQAGSLQKVINKNFDGLRVYVGMRHWHPFIKDTLKKMADDGIKKVIAINMAPQNSNASTGGYLKAVNEVLTEIPEDIKVDFVESWHDNPSFVKALSQKITEGMSLFKDSREDIYVLFSAHSLPKRVVEKDPYVDQLNETINSVVGLTGITDYSLAYQSKGGGSFEWLGPAVEDVLEELADAGNKNVLLVPLSFVADHIETLYDIDVVYKKKADELGLNLRRTDSFNDSPELIEAIAEIISSSLRGLAEQDRGNPSQRKRS